jgi:uncharacterized protein YegJ (DUF2314 family)
MSSTALTAFSAMFISVLAVGIVPAAAEGLLDNAQRDQIVLVPKGDPDMAAAMRKARATLPDFLALARAPRPSTSGFAVKVAIRDPGTENEYFWITPFREQDGRFIGRIDNIPRLVRSVRLGQTFAFSHGEIADWLYYEGGKMKGNYTACATTKREPGKAEAFKKEFGLECDF